MMSMGHTLSTLPYDILRMILMYAFSWGDLFDILFLASISPTIRHIIFNSPCFWKDKSTQNNYFIRIPSRKTHWRFNEIESTFENIINNDLSYLMSNLITCIDFSHSNIISNSGLNLVITSCVHLSSLDITLASRINLGVLIDDLNILQQSNHVALLKMTSIFMYGCGREAEYDEGYFYYWGMDIRDYEVSTLVFDLRRLQLLFVSMCTNTVTLHPGLCFECYDQWSLHSFETSWRWNLNCFTCDEMFEVCCFHDCVVKCIFHACTHFIHKSCAIQIGYTALDYICARCEIVQPSDTDEEDGLEAWIETATRYLEREA